MGKSVTTLEKEIAELTTLKRSHLRKFDQLTAEMRILQQKQSRQRGLVDQYDTQLAEVRFLLKLRTKGGYDPYKRRIHFDKTWWEKPGEIARGFDVHVWCGKHNGVTKEFTASGKGVWTQKMALAKRFARHYAETGNILKVDAAIPTITVK